jgi:hypothetical protein
MVKRFIGLLFFLCTTSFVAQDDFAKKLVSLGYENVRVFTKSNELYVGYENNRYRFEGDALVEVLKTLSNAKIPVGKQTHLLIYNTGLPVVYFNIPSKVLSSINNGSFSEEDTNSIYASLNVDKLESIYGAYTPFNNSFYKFDFQLGFHLDYQLGNFDNGVKEKLYARPNMQTVLGHGTQLNVSYQMVIINDLNNQFYSRPYMAVLSQDFKLPYNGFVNASLGYFQFNRFGYNIRFDKLLQEETFHVSINYGMSRYSYLDKEVIPIYNTNQQSFYNATINYRWKKHDIDFRFNYGTFMQNDLGYHFSISRQFEEKFVHLFYKKTNLGDVGGFGFIATLPQKKYLKPKKIRARLADNFKLNYNYFGNSIARSYETGPSLFSDMKEYYPSVLKKAIQKRLVRKN